MNAILLPEMRYRHWLRVEDFVVLQERWAFVPRGKTELIEGEVLELNAQFARHAYAKSMLHLAIDRGLRAIGSSLVAVVEAAVAMPPFDMPEPDIVITARPSRGGPLSINDIAAVVEVADTTQRYDLGRKASVYARNRIAEYWVVDLTASLVVRHTNPDSAGYAEVARFDFDAPIAATTIAGLMVDAGELRTLPED